MTAWINVLVYFFQEYWLVHHKSIKAWSWSEYEKEKRERERDGGHEPGKRKWQHVTAHHSLSIAALQRWACLLAKASICLRPCEEYPLYTTLILCPMLLCLLHANANSAGGSYIYKQLPWHCVGSRGREGRNIAWDKQIRTCHINNDSGNIVTILGLHYMINLAKRIYSVIAMSVEN